MTPYLLLLHLAGAISLLLWGVRVVRTAIERNYEATFIRLLNQSGGARVRAAAIGAGIAFLVQSSTAVAMLAAGFAGTGTLTLGTGIALTLGADLGSAAVVQILALDLTLLVPLLLIVGSLLFFRGTERRTRQSGRALVGVALVLVALGMIGQSTAPLREMGFLPDIFGYLSGDIFGAFLVAAALTWLLHSSVAAILLIASLAAHAVLPIDVAISMTLGANLGGALIAVGLTRHSPIDARRIAWGAFSFRGAWAVIALIAFGLVRPKLGLAGLGPGTLVALAHLAFNMLVLVVSLPFVDSLIPALTRLVIARPTPGELLNPLAEPASCLDQDVLNAPALALASATRELLRMADIIERMLGPLMELYQTGDPAKIRQARRLEASVDRAQSDIKLYLARIAYDGEADMRRGRELSYFAINLEYVGDAVSATLLKLAEVRRDRHLAFSEAGWRELSELHARVMSNMRLALNVLVNRDRESARQLLAEKDAMRSAEQASYGQHLERLRQGTAESMETSNIHLETVRALKIINSLFAGIAYPILAESGDLLDSRLAAQDDRV